MLLNYFFTPPLHTLTIKDPNNALALFIFIAVGMLVSSVVDLAARRTREAARGAAESRTLADLAVRRAGRGRRARVDARASPRDVRAALGDVVRARIEEGWRLVACAGGECTAPEEAETVVPAGEGRVIALEGRLLEADDQRVVSAFGSQVAVVLDRISLRAQASEADALAQIDRTRTALLAAVGHDLRTPLAAAKAAISTLRSVDLELGQDDRDELVATADESLDRLAGLISNLLDMSRLQAGAMAVELRPVAVDEVVARVLDDVGTLGVRVRVEVPGDVPEVLADPGLLERVLVNLVQNAIRFAPAGHPPRLTAAGIGEHVELRIVDQGPGHHPRAARRGLPPVPAAGRHRQHDRRRPRPRPVARTHRGDGRHPRAGGHPRRRTHDGGATPGRRRRRSGPGARAARTRPGGGLVTRVLVVDDEPQILRALAINLRARGYDVRTAGSGAEALATAAAHPPELVVLDLGLPDMDGTEVIAGLRGWTAVPVLVLSGRSDSSDKVDALDAGADDYVTKPFGMDELLARLRAMVRRGTPAGDDLPVVTLRRHGGRPRLPQGRARR